jgi:SAM-dependent methyltransferase
MIEVARERVPDVSWEVADLAALALPEAFDVVVAAGNVVPLVGAGAAPRAVAALAGHLRPGGLLVAGFGLTPAQLPPGVPPIPLAAYDEMCTRVGLRLLTRHSGWHDGPYDGGGYAVSVHRSPEGDRAD